MKTITKIGMIGALVFSMYSCAKPGCTDPNAVNYNASAKKDDYSCVYKEKLIFWQDQATSEIVQNAGITGLYIYVDGQLIGSTLATNYWTGVPSCEQSGNVNTEIDMGSLDSKLIEYEIKDNNGNLLASDIYIMNAGTCNIIKM
ncbi:MAG: hypothetical protein RL511_1754 [Bacteroidota bacterium]|jgi:hypothetical protein